MFACETITFAESFSGGKQVKVFAAFGHSVNNQARSNGASVQVSKLFMANIYAVYCAVKLVLLRKGRVVCDIFKESVLFLN